VDVEAYALPDGQVVAVRNEGRAGGCPGSGAFSSSGAIHATVPCAAPPPMVPRTEPPVPTSRASPKSVSCSREPVSGEVSITLAGLRSQCATRRACRCASPAATWCAAERHHARGGGGPSRSERSCSRRDMSQRLHASFCSTRERSPSRSGSSESSLSRESSTASSTSTPSRNASRAATRHRAARARVSSGRRRGSSHFASRCSP
jgi:hypothetical protein